MCYRLKEFSRQKIGQIVVWRNDRNSGWEKIVLGVERTLKKKVFFFSFRGTKGVAKGDNGLRLGYWEWWDFIQLGRILDHVWRAFRKLWNNLSNGVIWKFPKACVKNKIERKQNGCKKNDDAQDVIKKSPISIWSCKAFRFFLAMRKL